MLYDPNWQKTKDPLDINTLIAWLETKPAHEPYFIFSTRRCLLGQYFAAMGDPDPVYMSAQLGQCYTKLGRVAGIGTHRWFSTFGAALARAREIAAEP